MTEGPSETPPEGGGKVENPRTGGDYAPSVAARVAIWHRAGGIAVPLLTTILAFFIGGLVVLATTGKNPLTTYKGIFEGSGLNWFLEVGSYEIGIPFTESRVWFPWDTSFDSFAALNLQQTLIQYVPLVLTGLAVAFAFRCGMFNIGGQGQYLAGSITAVWIGSELPGLPGFVHILFAVVAGALAGAIFAGIAGFLKATVGAHEVITTIMLNYVALWVGIFFFGLGGPLQNDNPGGESVPVSNDVLDESKLNVFWGDPLLQGLHVGFFVALAGLVVYWITLNRTTLGYEVRAVGFNPEAARYGGISVARNYVLAMAISGTFAGLAGTMDILGWQFRLNTNDIQLSASAGIAFVGIAVALLGRNTAIGVGLSGLLFAALLTGTSTRNLDPEIFRPELASNLTLLIQGLVVLFVGADVLILYLFGIRKRARQRQAMARSQQ
jgi:general nucleoside transport system permease protein